MFLTTEIIQHESDIVPEDLKEIIIKRQFNYRNPVGLFLKLDLYVLLRFMEYCLVFSYRQ